MSEEAEDAMNDDADEPISRGNASNNTFSMPTAVPSSIARNARPNGTEGLSENALPSEDPGSNRRDSTAPVTGDGNSGFSGGGGFAAAGGFSGSGGGAGNGSETAGTALAEATGSSTERSSELSISVPPGAVVPAVLMDETPRTPQQQEALDKIVEDFNDAVSGGETDPDTWEDARQVADSRYIKLFGFRAYNQKHLEASRQAAAERRVAQQAPVAPTE
ncbi:MAG: hypothetical protein SFU53_00210 [Terrimicrobiaceae bacterium]|nr:hypothetical protein [Terrimicrobiaceae bacterium]